MFCSERLKCKIVVNILQVEHLYVCKSHLQISRDSSMCGCVHLNCLSQLIPLLLQKYLLRVGNTFTCNVEAELCEIEIESIDVTRKAKGCTIIMVSFF